MRRLARTVLTGRGYTVLEARDGADAGLIVQQHVGEIQLMVSDVVMPNMGGRQLAERMAILRPGIKVLYLSGYTDDAVVRHGIIDGSVPFLQKPFSPISLIRKVRELLDSGTEVKP